MITGTIDKPRETNCGTRAGHRSCVWARRGLLQPRGGGVPERTVGPALQIAGRGPQPIIMRATVVIVVVIISLFIIYGEIVE